MVRFVVRWPSRRKAWTAGSGAVAFLAASALVLSHPGPPPVAPVLAAPSVVLASATAAPTKTSSPQPPPATITSTPSTSANSVLVYATPLGGGILSMTETVRFTEPQPQLVLSPPDVSKAGPAFRNFKPSVSQIQLTVDGVNLQFRSSTLTSPLVVVLPAPGAVQVDVRYLLNGAMLRGASGGPAFVAPLVEGSADGVTTIVIGSAVTSFGCPQLPASTSACEAQAAASGAVGLISGLPNRFSLCTFVLPPDPDTSSTVKGSSSNPSTTSAPPAPAPPAATSTTPVTPAPPPAASSTSSSTPPPPPPTDTPTDPSVLPPTATADPTTPTGTSTTDPAPTETPTSAPSTPTETATPSPTPTTTTTPTTDDATSGVSPPSGSVLDRTPATGATSSTTTTGADGAQGDAGAQPDTGTSTPTGDQTGP